MNRAIGMTLAAIIVLSGIGGSQPRRSAGKIVPTGGSVWTFALMPE